MREPAGEDFERIKKYFEYAVAHAGTEGVVDDISASDLLINRIFEKIDGTGTNAGQSLLYGLLRSPCTTEEALSERTERIELFRTRADLRARIGETMSRIGRQKYESLVDELWTSTRIETLKYLGPVRVWMALTAFVFLSPILLGFQAFTFALLPILIVNVIITVRAKRKIGEHLEALMYLFRLLGGSGKLLKRMKDCTLPELDELRSTREKLKRIGKNGKYLIPLTKDAGDPISLFIEFGKFFFLLELHAFLSTYHLLESLRPRARRLYQILGSLDAYASVAEFLERESGAACRAEVSGGRGTIEFAGLVHPLVENCVGNSLTLAKGIVLTGTNMSGKSTFLRTLGINQVLALSFGFAFARSFATGFLPVLSSISTQDDLLARTSKYFAEARRLLTVIRTVAAGNARYLVLVDEILTGTNNEDRIRASVRILEKLSASGALVVSATHDLEIARALSGTYDNFHFSEKVERGSLEFDYTIKPGIVDQKNALRILAYLGYPDDILSALRTEDGSRTPDRI